MISFSRRKAKIYTQQRVDNLGIAQVKHYKNHIPMVFMVLLVMFCCMFNLAVAKESQTTTINKDNFSNESVVQETFSSLPNELKEVVNLNGEHITSVNIPKLEDLKKQIDAVNNDSSLSDEDKKQSLDLLQKQIDLLELYENLLEEEQLAHANYEKSPETLAQLEQSLSYANTHFTQEPPEVTSTNEAEVSSLLDTLNKKLSEVQTALNESMSYYSSLQTLPTRAQNTITANNDQIYSIVQKFNISDSKIQKLEQTTLAFEGYVLEYQNTLLQRELKASTIFQNIAHYKVRIYSLQKEYIINYITKVRAKQNELLSALILSNTADNDPDHLLQDIPELSQELKVNTQTTEMIDKTISDNVKLNKELQTVDAALTSIRHIEKSLQEQLSDLSGSLILSRLLNRHQGEIPHVNISFNLDELIPNLNLWMYDLRGYREAVFDTEQYINDVVKYDPKLDKYRPELEKIIKHRKTLFEQLYQSLSEELTTAIELRAKYNELQSSNKRVNNVIKDHLFWLASNHGISVDFFRNFYPTIELQFKGFLKFYAAIDSLEELIFNFIKIIIPLVGFGVFFHAIHPWIKRHLNSLALRLDKPNDGYLVTPKALILHWFDIIPLVCAISFVGTFFIFITLDDYENQKHIAYLLALHLSCFLFMRKIMGPNSLAQRHFSAPPKLIAKNRNIIDQVWFVSVPMIMIANMRELEPVKIAGDILGYTLMLCGFLYLSIFAIKTVRHRFDEYSPTFTFWMLSILGIITPVTITIMLGLGYYYTIIQLLNRVAITMYIGFLYLIISHTLRRELYVAEIKMLRKAKLRLLAQGQNIKGITLGNLGIPKSAPSSDKKDENKAENNRLRKYKEQQAKQSQQSRPNKLELLHFELVNEKAFKLINAILLCGFLYLMYLQWSDLAGVLSYLDKIYIWTNSNIVDGKTIISNYLSVGDVLLAILIVVIGTILNHNLPLLVERLFMIREGATSKSTSYTLKIITSYIISALVIIFAASALGISWDNLQWLVAALSVGLGFGLQEIFANFVSGLIILFERQIRVGDIVTLKDLSGTVNKIRIRATTIISFENKEVVIPNREFITSALTNWSLSNTVTKLEFAVGVGYSSDVTKAKELLAGIIRRCRNLSREQKPSIYIKSLDDSAITIMCEVYVTEIGKRKETFDFLSTETLRIFNDNNIEIPFNKLDVTIIKTDDQSKSVKLPTQTMPTEAQEL